MSDERHSAIITLQALEPVYQPALAVWAERLGLQAQADADFALQLGAYKIRHLRI